MLNTVRKGFSSIPLHERMRLFGTKDEEFALKVAKQNGWECEAGTGLLRVPRGEFLRRTGRRELMG